MSVLAGSERRGYAIAFDEEVTVRWRDIDRSGLNRIITEHVTRSEITRALKNFRKNTFRVVRNVHHHEKRGVYISGDLRDHRRECLDTTRGCANHDDPWA